MHDLARPNEPAAAGAGAADGESARAADGPKAAPAPSPNSPNPPARSRSRRVTPLHSRRCGAEHPSAGACSISESRRGVWCIAGFRSRGTACFLLCHSTSTAAGGLSRFRQSGSGFRAHDAFPTARHFALRLPLSASSLRLGLPRTGHSDNPSFRPPETGRCRRGAMMHRAADGALRARRPGGRDRDFPAAGMVRMPVPANNGCPFRNEE